MRRLIVGVLLGLALLARDAEMAPVPVGLAQPATPVAATPIVDEAAHLRQLVVDRLQALVAADLTAVDAIYAPDYAHISQSGVVVSREAYLAPIASGEHDYRVLEPASEITVRLYGDAAVLTYQSRVDLMSYGMHITGYGWHTEVYERRDGRWLLVWGQTTRVLE